MKLSKSGIELKDAIAKAIQDCVITTSEYDEILMIANKDGHVDKHEQQLLGQLQALIANGTIERTKG